MRFLCAKITLNFRLPRKVCSSRQRSIRAWNIIPDVDEMRFSRISPRGSMSNGRERKTKREVISGEGRRRHTRRRRAFRRERWSRGRRVSLHFEPSINLFIFRRALRFIIFIFFFPLHLRNQLCVTRFLRLYRTFPNGRDATGVNPHAVPARAHEECMSPCRCTIRINDTSRNYFEEPRQTLTRATGGFVSANQQSAVMVANILIPWGIIFEI